MDDIMSKRIFSVLIGALLHLSTFSIIEAKNDAPLFGKTGDVIEVNNRILANVRDHSISVIDVMKKMDILFYRQYPHYASMPSIRFQFYQASWKAVLQELIDKELIMADAEERQFSVSNGDIRQEMESMFGPNIIVNLDSAGLTYDEAWKIVHGDTIIRRMVYMCVNLKAMRNTTPQDVRTAYEEYAKANVRPDMWDYSVISIRDPDPEKGAKAANVIHNLLVQDKIPLEATIRKIEELKLVDKTTIVNVSEQMHHGEKELSKQVIQIFSRR